MVQLFLLEVAGLRIAWKKFKGGVEVEYVGYWMDLARFRLGVSIKRRGWLEKTLNGYVQNGRIMVKTAEAHVGRFSFAFLALGTLATVFGFISCLVVCIAQGCLRGTTEGFALGVKFLVEGSKDVQRSPRSALDVKSTKD